MTNHSPARISVFLVDDLPLVRQGLALLLAQSGFVVGGEAESLAATLAHPGLTGTQVIVLDLTLERSSGLDLIPTLCRRDLRVVVYSMHEDPALVQRALINPSRIRSP